MQLRVLGPVELAAQGRRVTVGSDRQRTILAVLLARPDTIVSPDRLMDALWGDDPPPSAHASLHSHISRLRRMLRAAEPGAEQALRTDGDGYRLELRGHELDAARFEELIEQARDGGPPRQVLEPLEQALGLWRGSAFGDLATNDAVRPTATRLERQRATAIADRFDAMLALGRHAEVIAELEAAVEDDELAERPHGQLMLALYRSGRQADALAVFRGLQRRLQEELGVDPSPDLQRLHERLLRQDPYLTTVDAAPAVDAARHHDPEPAAPVVRQAPSIEVPVHGELFGRADEVAAIASLLDTVPLVTLTGPGGVGKTRLALEVAAAARSPGGVGWCPLAAIEDPGSVPAAVLAALGIAHPGDRSARDTLVTALGGRPFLIVLDDCERLLTTVAALVDDLRDHCPALTILATSREHLHLPRERVWEVTPLAVPLSDASAAEVAQTPAGAMFCARAQAANPRFALTADSAAAVADICRRLDGLPLALELAAARIRALRPGDLADRLDQRFRLLTAGSPGGAGRHRTLSAVVDWSYELLTDAEARLFDRLSVFAGSFTLGAAEQVCADEDLPAEEIAGLLADLIDRSMVTTTYADGALRYRLLHTMRAYGAQHLEAAGDADRFRQAHARHHVEGVERLAPAMRGADERQAVDRIEQEVDNLRAAHAWAVGSGDVDLALRLPVALHDYIHYRLRDEMVTWTERALELPDARQHAAAAAALATAARGALHRGAFDHAREAATTALAEAERDEHATLWALHALTEVALYRGELDEVRRLADERSELAERLGEDYYRALAGVSNVLADVYGGAPEAAIRHAQAAWEAAEACGNHTVRAWVLYAHGEALLDADPDQAAALLERAIDTGRLVDSRLATGVALASLASLHGRRGEEHRALELFRDAITHWRGIGDETHQLTTLRNLAELLTRLDPGEDAAVLLGAVTGSAAAPSFGVEADRLEEARTALERPLGAHDTAAAAARGSRLTAAQTVDQALALIDGLLDADRVQRRGR